MEGDIAELKTEKAEVIEKLEVKKKQVIQLNADNEELRMQDEAKAEQLKAIQRKIARASEGASKMGFDAIKELLGELTEMTMPGFLPSPEEEATAEQRLPAVTPKRPTHVQVKKSDAELKKVYHTSLPQPTQQRNVAPRKTTNPTTKPTSMPKWK